MLGIPQTYDATSKAATKALQQADKSKEDDERRKEALDNTSGVLCVSALDNTSQSAIHYSCLPEPDAITMDIA